MGNGHKCRTGIDPKPKPMVMFDGVTPTFETTQHGLYCGCSKPIIDPCSGFPKCEGKIPKKNNKYSTSFVLHGLV